MVPVIIGLLLAGTVEDIATKDDGGIVVAGA